MLSRQRGLAGARRTDQDHQRELGDLQRFGHDAPSSAFDVLVKMAICVGAPVVGSSVPMPMNRTSYWWRLATPRAHASSSGRVHSKRWSLWRNLPPASPAKCTLYSAFGVVSTTVPGRANSNTTRSNA